MLPAAGGVIFAFIVMLMGQFVYSGGYNLTDNKVAGLTLASVGFAMLSISVFVILEITKSYKISKK